MARSIKPKGSTAEHQRIVYATLILLGKEAHHVCRVWDNPTGVAYRIDDVGRKQWVTYGFKGSPDIIGILMGGKFLGIEIKSGCAMQQENQKKFESMILSFQGIYFVARSAEEALHCVLRVSSSSKPIL
jgi:hypothetical protein